MLVFVDESGDAGMKFDQGSSPFFIVTAVLFEDRDEAQKCDDAISELRGTLGRRSGTEFHFSKATVKTRRRFLTEVMSYEFFYIAVVLNKRKLTGPGFQFKDSLIKYTSKLVFQNAKLYLDNAIVVIDGSGSRDFRNQLKRYLQERIKEENGQRLIKKVKTSRSHGNNLIQLADMLCGALWRSLRHDDFSYRDIVSARERRVLVWPG